MKTANIRQVANGYVVTLSHHGVDEFVASTWAEMIEKLETHFVDGPRYNNLHPKSQA